MTCTAHHHPRVDGTDRCSCGAFRWRKGTKYRVHQGIRERLRRLRQVACDQVTPELATPAARQSATQLFNPVATASAPAWIKEPVSSDPSLSGVSDVSAGECGGLDEPALP